MIAFELTEEQHMFRNLARQFADRLARVYVNEALSAGSLDTSSVIVPAAMERVALGSYVAREFHGPMRRCLRCRTGSAAAA